MNWDLIIGFGNHILILMGTSVIYSLFKDQTKFKPIIRKILMGLSLSVVIFFVMTQSMVLDEIDQGIRIDSRAVVLSVSGMFFGFIPTLIAGLLAISIRVFYGGDGLLTGILWIVVSSVLGLLWRYVRVKKNAKDLFKITWIELYGFALVVQIFMVLLLTVLPDSEGIQTMNIVAFPLLIVFPLGQLLISRFILGQRKQYFTDISRDEQLDKFRETFNKNKSILLIIEPETQLIIDTNDKAIETYGYTYKEITTMKISQLNALPHEEVAELISYAMEEKQEFFLLQHRKKNGAIIDVEVHAGPIVINGNPYVLSTVIDVSEKMKSQKMFQDADDRLRATLLSVGDGIIVTDEFDRITVINEKALNLLGVTNDIERKKIVDELRIYSNQSDITFQDIYTQCLEQGNMYRSDSTFSLITKKDEMLFVDFTISPIQKDTSEVHGAIIVLRDITIEKKRQEEIRFMSRHDYLTGLYNRYNFELEIERINTTRQLPISIIVGDVNGLKLVNDAFGHLEGDKLLKEVSQIFNKATRGEDIVARWGGDEFAILLPQTNEKGVQSVIDRIADLCDKSLYDTIQLSIAIGSATKHEESQSIEDLLSIAEERMYTEKVKMGPSMRDALMHRIFTVLNERIINNKQHVDSIIHLSNKYCDYHKLDDQYRKHLILLAKYHDIGRITIDKDIWNKQGPLDDNEWQRVKTHAEVGSRLVASIPELQFIAQSVLQHHERYDGTGYPMGLKGKAIDEHARLLAIMEAYDSMTHTQVYKERMSKDEAINELLKNTGSQFDRELVRRFLRII
jgi:diguanylate cyclase (GGDEF)-like protein/PAS domain S-box-containing protein